MRIWLSTKTQDEEFNDLRAAGHTGSLNDMQFAYLDAAGYSGALADKMAAAAGGDFTAPVLSGNSFNDTTDAATFTTTEGGTFIWATHLTTESVSANGSGGWTGTTLETGTDTVATSGESTISAAYTATTGTGGESRKFSYYVRDAAGNDSNVITETFTVNSTSSYSLVGDGQDRAFSSSKTFNSGSTSTDALPATFPAGTYYVWSMSELIDMTALTVDGVSGTLIVSSTTTARWVYLWEVTGVTGGNTDNIVVTMASNTSECDVVAYVTNGYTRQATDVGGQNANPSTADVSMNTNAGDLILAVWRSDITIEPTLVGLTSDLPLALNGKAYGSCINTSATGGTPETFTITQSEAFRRMEAAAVRLSV